MPHLSTMPDPGELTSDWQLHVVRSSAEMEALRPHWDGLLERSACPSPFSRWDWLWRWHQQFRDEHELAIGVARDGRGEVRGIAPLMLRRGSSGGRRWMRHLMQLGGEGPVVGERQDWLVARGDEAEVMPVLCQTLGRLRREWDAILLRKLPAESPLLPYMRAVLQSEGSAARQLYASSCQICHLPPSLEAYEATHSSRWRRNLRNRWRGLMEDHAGGVGLVSADDDVAARVDQFSELHRQHYPDGRSSFVETRAWEFHRGLAVDWLREGRASMPYLTSAGRLIAALYCLKEGETMYQYQMGWEATFSKLSLGYLVMRHGFDAAIRSGVRTYDLLPGEAGRYKAEWCPEVRWVLDWEAFRPGSARALLFRGMRGLQRLAHRRAPVGAAAAPEGEEVG